MMLWKEINIVQERAFLNYFVHYYQCIIISETKCKGKMRNVHFFGSYQQHIFTHNQPT